MKNSESVSPYCADTLRAALQNAGMGLGGNVWATPSDVESGLYDTLQERVPVNLYVDREDTRHMATIFIASNVKCIRPVPWWIRLAFWAAKKLLDVVRKEV